MSPPLTCRSRSTSRLLLTLVVPVAAPISRVVAAPAKFTVVAVAFNRLNVVWLVVMSPPLTSRSRSTTRLLLTLVVPVAAPISSVVAAPAKFTVVVVVLAILNTASVVTISAVPNVRSASSVIRPVTVELPALLT